MAPIDPNSLRRVSVCRTSTTCIDRIQSVVATPRWWRWSMGRPAGWMTELTGRSPMRSPGAPRHRREVERRFWREIATGVTSEEAAARVGVASAVGCRWFRHGGDMPPMNLDEPTGRFLSFREREEIAVLRAQGV